MYLVWGYPVETGCATLDTCVVVSCGTDTATCVCHTAGGVVKHADHPTCPCVVQHDTCHTCHMCHVQAGGTWCCVSVCTCLLGEPRVLHISSLTQQSKSRRLGQTAVLRQPLCTRRRCLFSQAAALYCQHDVMACCCHHLWMQLLW